MLLPLAKGTVDMSVHCQYNSVIMLTQKLYKNGNSVAVTIPKEYLEDLNLKPGTLVVVKKEGDELIVTSKKKNLASDVDIKFAKQVEEFINDHQDVLQKLAEK